MRRKVLYGIGAIVLILIATNPDPNDFKSYLHQNAQNDPAGRDWNFIVFSIYSNYGDYLDSPRDGHQIKYSYIGILGNFFTLGAKDAY